MEAVDKLVAEEIMGWHMAEYEVSAGGPLMHPELQKRVIRREWQDKYGIYQAEADWSPSTDDSAAMQLVRHVLEHWNPSEHHYPFDAAFSLEGWGGGKSWEAGFGGDDRDFEAYLYNYRAQSGDPALAICLAALRAFGVDYDTE